MTRTKLALALFVPILAIGLLDSCSQSTESNTKAAVPSPVVTLTPNDASNKISRVDTQPPITQDKVVVTAPRVTAKPTKRVTHSVTKKVDVQAEATAELQGQVNQGIASCFSAVADYAIAQAIETGVIDQTRDDVVVAYNRLDQNGRKQALVYLVGMGVCGFPDIKEETVNQANLDALVF